MSHYTEEATPLLAETTSLGITTTTTTTTRHQQRGGDQHTVVLPSQSGIYHREEQPPDAAAAALLLHNTPKGSNNSCDNNSNGNGSSKPSSGGSRHNNDDLLMVSDENHFGSQEGPRSSVCSAIFNLTNTIIGAGVLSLPFAFKHTGVVLGPLILFLVYILVLYSCRLLISCSKLTGGKTYMEIAHRAYGPRGVLATQLSIIVSTFGACTGYLVIIGDMFGPLIGEWMGGTRENFCSLYADRRFSISLSLLVVGPLSLVRHIDSLKYTSYLAILFMAYLVIVVVVRSGTRVDQGTGEEVNFSNITETIFRAVPIVTLAYTCQMNLFSLLYGLQKPTRSRIRKVLFSSLTVCLLAYTAVGLFGYLTFFTSTQGNVLLNYDTDDVFVMVGRVGVAIVIICSFPLLAHPCLDTVDDLVFPNRRHVFSYRRRLGALIVVVGLAYTIAMLVDDVSVVLGIAGATGSTSISFVLPALFYTKLSPKPALSAGKILPWALLGLGLVFFFASTVITVLEAVEDAGPELGNLCQALSNNSSSSGGGGGNSTVVNNK